MRIAAILVGCVGALCFRPAPIDAQGVEDLKYDVPIDAGRVAIQAALDRTPGIAVAVSVGRDVVWSEGFGYANLEEEIPVESNTIFRIFSLSKAITSVAMMRLEQAGRIELDEPISSLVEGLPERVGVATPRQLAGHLGGIRHYKGGEAWNDRYCETPDAAVAIFVADASVHAPGTEFLYSSWGYALLSRVLEAASGMSFDELVDREVLGPAGMTSTSLGRGVDPRRTTRFYERRGLLRKRNQPAEEVDISCKWGGGAFLSTAPDMAKMGAALMDGTVLDERALQTFLTEMKTVSGGGTGYAMGLGVASDRDGRVYYSHTGSGVGGRSAFLLFPREELVVVVLANNREEAVIEVGATIARAFLDHTQVPEGSSDSQVPK